MSEQLLTASMPIDAAPQPDNAVVTASATSKINLLDLNRQQMREFFCRDGREAFPCRSGHEVDVPLLL